MENQQETKKEDIKETIERLVWLKITNFIMIAVVYICVLFGMLSVLSIGHSNGYGQSIIINMVILTIPLVICTILHYSSGKSLNKRIKEELGKM
jgi:heme/copper-type cytochrome/quinol oxidase subunit 2